MDFIAEHAKLIGLLFFFTVFMAITIYVYRPGKKVKKEMEEHANIPLKADEENNPKA